MPLESLISQFDAFLDEAHRLKAYYSDKINLLVGLETEYITPSDLDKLAELLPSAGSRIEYLVGSVHHVNTIPIDFDRETFNKSLETFSSPSASDHHRMDAFLCSYFDAQYELMQRFRPEIIGHFDLCRLYNPALRFADYPTVLDKINRNIQFAVAYGALFELNAAAFRKGWDDAYPGEDVVKVKFEHISFSALHRLPGPADYRSSFRRADTSHCRTTVTDRMPLGSITIVWWNTVKGLASPRFGCFGHHRLRTPPAGTCPLNV